MATPPAFVKQTLALATAQPQVSAMADRSKPLSREERLAAKLRENLKRRKQQSRVQAQTDAEPSQTKPQ